jgi:hypothetical protein
VIDCSPEGHQPGVNTRIFQAVQQPVCIVLASRSANSAGGTEVPAKVRFRSLQTGHREKKFEELLALRLSSKNWIECPSDWRAPFVPVSTGAWASYPRLGDLFVYGGSGVQPKRTWVIAPDAESLLHRWQTLIDAPEDQKEHLFHATLRNGLPADRHIRSVVKEGVPGFEANLTPLIDENGPSIAPVLYAYRSFDRQWIIPDARLITQPNAELWSSRSDVQVYLTAFIEESPTSGPALTFSGLIPDLHHYKGSFGGRVFPLWRDRDAQAHNLRPKLLSFLKNQYQSELTADDVMAYIAAIAAHSAYTQRFQDDLSTPGLRIPLTADSDLFAKVAKVGRKVIWLHTFGERMADENDELPPGPPRLPEGKRPYIPTAGSIPTDPENMPDSIDYDAGKHKLLLGQGYIENVESAVWLYEVSGKQVLPHWFSYRKKNRERPIIGDRRPPSPLGDIQPDHWLPEYTTELLNVLNVLGLLVELEPAQVDLLDKVCSGPLISGDDLSAAGALELPPKAKKKKRTKKKTGPGLFDSHGAH